MGSLVSGQVVTSLMPGGSQTDMQPDSIFPAPINPAGEGRPVKQFFSLEPAQLQQVTLTAFFATSS